MRESSSRQGAFEAPSVKESSRPSRLWWLYFGYLVLSGVIAAGPYVSSIREEHLSGRMLALPIVATLLNLWGLVGLWGYIGSRRLAWSGFWQICLGLTVIQWIFAASLFARALGPGAGSGTSTTAALGLLGLALGVPLLVALWRYAFLSPQIWGR